MRFAITTVAMILTSIMLQMVIPWWSIAIAAAVVGLFSRLKPGWAFVSGLLGVGLVWLVAAWLLDNDNNGLLSAKVAQILPVGSAVALLAVTVAVGALVGGFAALTGSTLGRIIAR